MLNRKTVAVTTKELSKLDGQGIVDFRDFDQKAYEVFGRKSAEVATQYKKAQTTDGFASSQEFFRWFEESVIDGKTFKQHRQDLFSEYCKYFGHSDDKGNWVGKDQEKVYVLEKKLQDLVMRIYDENTSNPVIVEKILAAHSKYASQYGNDVSFFVRSSGKFEDMDVAQSDGAGSQQLAEEEEEKVTSAAGQNTTVPNVIGAKNLVRAWFECIASLYNARSMSDRFESGFDEDEAAMMVTFHRTIQSMVAGIGFSIESLTGNPHVIKVTLGYGQGEPLVAGTYGTCIYYADKRLVERRAAGEDIDPIIKKIYVPQDKMEIATKDGGLKEIAVPDELKNRFPVIDATVADFMVKMLVEEEAQIIEGKITNPYVTGRDIEIAGETKDGEFITLVNTPDNLLFTQSRAEVNFSKRFQNGYYTIRYEAPNIPLTKLTSSGIKAGKSVAIGRIQIVRQGDKEIMQKDMVKLGKAHKESMEKENIGVIYMGEEANPDVNDALTIATGMIIGQANTECHGAILAKAKGKAAGVQMFKSMKVDEVDGKLRAICVDQHGKTHIYNDGDLVTLAVIDQEGWEKPTILEGAVEFKKNKLFNDDIPFTNREIRSIVADSGISLSTSQVSDRVTENLWLAVYQMWAEELANSLPVTIEEREAYFNDLLAPIAADIKMLAKSPVEISDTGKSILKAIGDVHKLLAKKSVDINELKKARDWTQHLTKTKIALFRTEFIYAQQVDAHPLLFHEYKLHKDFVTDMLAKFDNAENIAARAKTPIGDFIAQMPNERFKAFVDFRRAMNNPLIKNKSIWKMSKKKIGIESDQIREVVDFMLIHAKTALQSINPLTKKGELQSMILGILDHYQADKENAYREAAEAVKNIREYLGHDKDKAYNIADALIETIIDKREEPSSGYKKAIKGLVYGVINRHIPDNQMAFLIAEELRFHQSHDVLKLMHALANPVQKYESDELEKLWKIDFFKNKEIDFRLDVNDFFSRLIDIKKMEIAKARKAECEMFPYEADLVRFIEETSAGYESPSIFLKETLKQEIRTMHSLSGDVEIRLYDNKPAEIKGYKGADTKIGGMAKISRVAQNEEFDPVRGSGLFLTPEFTEAWKAIELAAIKELQDEMAERYGEDARTTIKPFVVFSRSPQEFYEVLNIVEGEGIVGTGMMVEVAENFINLMGYAVKPPAFLSIGGNDGEATIHAIARVDRYRDIPGLDKNVSEALIGSIIKTAYFARETGIPLYSCGQNNSNNPLIAMMSAVLPFNAVGVTDDVRPEVMMAVREMEDEIRNQFVKEKDGKNTVDEEAALRYILGELFAPLVTDKSRVTGIDEAKSKEYMIEMLLQYRNSGIAEGRKVMELREQLGLN